MNEADLSAYRRLRDFSGTPEPTGEEPLLEVLYTGRRDPAGTPGTYRGRFLGDSPVRLPARPSPDLLRFVIHKHAATRLHYDLRLERGGALKSWAVPHGLPLDPGTRHLAIQTEDHPLAYMVFDDAKVAAALVGHRVTGVYELVRTRDDHWLLFRLSSEGPRLGGRDPAGD